MFFLFLIVFQKISVFSGRHTFRNLAGTGGLPERTGGFPREESARETRIREFAPIEISVIPFVAFSVSFRFQGRKNIAEILSVYSPVRDFSSERKRFKS